MENRYILVTVLLVVLVLMAGVVVADYFPRSSSTIYPAITELGTIANGGTATCAFATTPICHWTVASGSGGWTIANPSNNPPTIGQVVTIVWQQASTGFPAITWGSAWFGFNAVNKVAALNTIASALTNNLAYSNAATGVAALSFEWDGTEYVLSTPQTLLADTVVGATNLFTNTLLTVGGNVSMSSSTTSHNYIMSFNNPTISSGFGGTPSVGGNVGTAAFTVNVGTGGSASSGVLGMPLTATTGWRCHCDDLTTQTATVFVTKQTASATNSCTIGNFNTSGAAAAWVASDILACGAMGY